MITSALLHKPVSAVHRPDGLAAGDLTGHLCGELDAASAQLRCQRAVEESDRQTSELEFHTPLEPCTELRGRSDELKAAETDASGVVGIATGHSPAAGALEDGRLAVVA